MTDPHDVDLFDDDPIEGYCMSCRDTVEIEDAQAVWTRKGQAATKGVCSVCTGTVFRMGSTYLHDAARRPDPVVVGDEGKDKRIRPKLTRDTVYVSFSPPDAATAQQLAADLEKSGFATWLHAAADRVNWSGGVHPALQECGNLVVVLSQAAIDDESVAASWSFFRDKRKPIVIAQVASVTPPDPLRRSPRYDVATDYKAALRQIVRVVGQS